MIYHGKINIAAIMLGLLVCLTTTVRADSDQYKSAYQLYLQGDLQKARELFAQIDGYAARMAEADMTYLLKKYQQAIPIFVQAVYDAQNPKQRAQAIFNLANCYYQLKNYQQASLLYQDVLRYLPDHAAAKVNLSYALAIIDAESPPIPNVSAATQGRGPGTSDAPPGTEITTGRLTLGDQTTSTGESDTNANNTDTGISQDSLLHSRPASENVDLNSDKSWTYDITSIEVLRQLDLKSNTDESVLWQRMFEYEEGYPAPQESAHGLPGVTPW